MALSITITDVGRAALVNAQNTGSTAMVINRIGVSASHAVGDLKALTVLPNERKKLATIAGDVVADDVIHVTIRDDTTDAYDLRAFGVYFANNVLFAVCTQAEPIMQKAAAAMLLQAVDITLTTLDTEAITFGEAGFTNPPATTDRMGVVELATFEETLALEDATRAVTPFGLGRTLLAWAANFAAKVHGHVIGDIQGLTEALGSKSPTGHQHAAADITSGTFNIARIPAIAMGGITGLVDALATKAASVHEHAASDITSGTFNIARIPAIAMGGITGLVDALASKSPTGHQHAAADITSGTFNIARIPAIAMGGITGLVDALADKASAAISIVAGNGLTGGGTLGASRTVTLGTPLPVTGASTDTVTATGHSHSLSLGTADVTGLTAALDSKAAAAIQVIAGNGLTGGGTLAANRTVTLGAPTAVTGASGNTVTATGHTHSLSLGINDVTGLPEALAGAATTTGVVVHFAQNTAPTGWLPCNGVAVSRSTYAALFAAIGTVHGAGNGNTTFNVPDLRGEFIRGWDQGRGVDSGRAFGSAQADELRAHTHLSYAGTGQGSTSIPAVDNDGNTANKTNPTSSTGGVETRPRNVALLPCIKT
ncbi:Phage Tail Collar Domain protein [compost metagenome]